MRCEEVQAKRLELLDGVLDAGPREEIEAHLEECAACRRDIAELRAAWELLDLYPVAEAGAGAAGRMTAAILDGAREIHRREKAAARWRRALPAAAAVVIAVSLAWVFFGGGAGGPAVEPAPGQGDVAAAAESAEAEAIENLDLLEDLDLLQAVGDDLDLVAEYESYVALGGEEAY